MTVRVIDSYLPGEKTVYIMTDRELNRYVLHGSWLPDNDGGRFAIWAETSGAKRKGSGKHEHPFQPAAGELQQLVKSVWPGMPEPFKEEPVWAVLPGHNGRPTASPELQTQSTVDKESPDEWLACQLTAVTTRNPLTPLMNLDQLRASETARPGNDLRFWFHMAKRVSDAIKCHEFMPGIYSTAGQRPETKPASTRTENHKGRKPKRQSKKTGYGLQLSVGWELLHSAFETDLARLAECAPGICRSLWPERPTDLNGTIPLHDAEGLIRSFASATLNRQIWQIHFPNTVRKLVDRTCFASVLDPSGRPTRQRNDSWPVMETEDVTEEHWHQWHRWRERINRASARADEQICFRLSDPDRSTPDAWQLEWLLSSRKDPSRLVPLQDYWRSDRSGGDISEILLQLGQAARLYGRLWDGMESGAPDSVTLSRAEALAFLREHGPILQGAGFRIIVPSWWTATGQRRLRLQLNAKMSPTAKGSGSESSGMLGMASIVEWTPVVVIDGVALSPEEWEEVLRSKQELIHIRGQWMELREEEVARLEEYWNNPHDLAPMTVADLIRVEAEPNVEIQAQGDLKNLMDSLRDFGGLEIQKQPKGFVGELRNYQLRGYSWLSCLEGYGFGTILADDMGLGKTVQVLATVLNDRRANPHGGPTLLVAPTSVLGNWQREAGKFTPDLVTGIHHGSARAKSKEEFLEQIEGVDLVIVSFGVARLDKKLMGLVKWHRLVIDEAQNVKNPTAAITKALKSVPAHRRIALTGTPVENRLMDLWSLYDVINPGMLGKVADFRKEFEKPIMRHADQAALERLRGIVRPFILRRLKSDKSIISDLPDKVEQNVMCSLTTEQAGLYEAVVRDVDRELENEASNNRQGVMLSALTRLKQICNHPAQFLQDGSEFSASRSHKLERVCEMIDEIQAEGDSVLVFTQFTEIGRNLEALLRQRSEGRVFYLHGGTPRALREDMVEKFQDPDSEASIFVLSLRAAGVGITLTRANHVIHFDRWWNPAVENQATDRAYRIGQEKMVMVHKCVTIGTLEERIDALIESKRQLAEDVVGADESWLSDMGSETFRELIRLDRAQAVLS